MCVCAAYCIIHVINEKTIGPYIIPRRTRHYMAVKAWIMHDSGTHTHTQVRWGKRRSVGGPAESGGGYWSRRAGSCARTLTRSSLPRCFSLSLGKIDRVLWKSIKASTRRRLWGWGELCCTTTSTTRHSSRKKRPASCRDRASEAVVTLAPFCRGR